MPAAAFRKGQRVLISYGSIRIWHAHGKMAVGGHVRRRVKPDWYEVELGWDVNAQQLNLVTAHKSAITANGHIS